MIPNTVLDEGKPSAFLAKSAEHARQEEARVLLGALCVFIVPTKKLNSPVASGCKKNPWYYRGSGLLTRRWLCQAKPTTLGFDLEVASLRNTLMLPSRCVKVWASILSVTITIPTPPTPSQPVGRG